MTSAREAIPFSPLLPSAATDGELLARYEVGAPLARGGFGALYRGKQRSTGQDVAIKALRLEADAPDAEERIQRFRRETRLCAALHHPNIVRLIDAVQSAAGAIYAVFELVRGNDLADVLAAEGALPTGETLHLMGQVLDALACAHAEGVIHRDLKPANIMITSGGARRNAMILDFGLGVLTGDAAPDDVHRLTPQGDYLGTPSYSAPEQLRAEPASPESDLFAWGLVFLECLSGSVEPGPLAQVIHRRLGPEPVAIPPALFDHELGRILTSVLEKDRARRAGSASRVLAELVQCASGPLPSVAELRAARRTTRSAGARPLGALSRVWQVPLRRNPNFTGRESLLEELADSLRQRRLLAIVALRGLGGVGKTQIALEYAYRYGDAYDLVAWLRAGAPESLAEDFAALAPALGLPEQASPNQRQRIAAVRAWLERNERWLVIFDNAPNPDAIRPYLPRSSAGHVLMTSRHQSWRELGTSIAVEELPAEEAVAYLQRRTGESDRAAAARLAEELGRLPLALEEAAAYIESTGRSIDAYLRLLREQQKVLLEAPSLPDYPSTLGGTWELCFREVEEELPEAADLLRLCAFLAPDDIPFALLRDGHPHLTPGLAAAVTDALRFDRCVAALRRFSLVKVEGETLALHRLVQLVTRERLPPPERARWAERALRVAETSFPPSGLAGDLQPAAGRLLPHALAALAHAPADPACAIWSARLLNRSGNYLSARGFHEQASRYQERALALFAQAPDASETQVANVYSDLGLIRFALGDGQRARASIERALEIDERLRGPDHLRVSIDLMNLAYVLRGLGDAQRVRECSTRALAILDETLGPEHPLVAQGLSTLCRARFELGELDAARRDAARALAILADQELYHPLLTSCWSNLARFQLDVGDLDESERCVQRSLEIGERAYGPDHPLVAFAMEVRGSIQERRGDLASARASFERSIQSGERSCHHLHAEIALSRSQLGDVLRRQGDPARAAATLSHAREGIERVCGEPSLLRGHVEAATAALHADRDEFSLARAHAERAHEALAERYPRSHPYFIPLHNLRARIALLEGAPDSAATLAESALASGAAAFGGRHPDLAETHRQLADLAALRRDPDRERSHRALERLLRTQPREGPLMPRRPLPPRAEGT